LAALKAGRIAVAPVYSPRGARLLTATYDDGWSLSSTHAVAISAAAADPLTPLPFRSVTVAARPHGTAMIDAIIDRLSEISRCTAPWHGESLFRPQPSHTVLQSRAGCLI